MGRPRRAADGGLVYHVLNRANARLPIFEKQQDYDHFYAVCRYVERNALRANLVQRAEQWLWGSLYRWTHRTEEERPLLATWPVPQPASWLEYVNAPQTDAELAALRRCVTRGGPLGESAWCDRMARRLGLENTLRPQKTQKRFLTPFRFQIHETART